MSNRKISAESQPGSALPLNGYKGRGALTSIAHRFESLAREAVDDGWSTEVDDRAPETVIIEEQAKSIIARNDSPDVPFDQSVNPYRGCEHGCVYCFARPTHSYLNLSPGLDFETRIFAKVNAAALLRKELSRPGYRCTPLAIGVATDAYQPAERRLRLTRQVLEVCAEFNQPVGFITKSARIEDDLELIAQLAARKLATVALSITTLDHAVSRHMEPRTTAPLRRIETIRRFAEAGVPVTVNVAPIVPFLTDHELERILEAAADAGARGAGMIMLRLPWEVEPIFRDWLEARFPLKAAHVLSRIESLRGGRHNDARFGSRMAGVGIYADLIAKRFAIACKRLGLNEEGRQRMQTLDVTQFRVPSAQGRLEW